jgi:hypothetical protein
MYCINKHTNLSIQRGETVVIVDAGGGTVDAVTYKCDNDEPLRLSSEVVTPDSEYIGLFPRRS